MGFFPTFLIHLTKVLSWTLDVPCCRKLGVAIPLFEEKWENRHIIDHTTILLKKGG